MFAACAFVLWFWAALINRLAQAVGLSTPEHLANAAASIASSSTLQAIVSIWLLTAATAIAFPAIWRPLTATTTLMFDVGYGILGALTGFGLAIGLSAAAGTYSAGHWSTALASRSGNAVIRKMFPLSEMGAYGTGRWIVAGILFLASPMILLWGLVQGHVPAAPAFPLHQLIGKCPTPPYPAELDAASDCRHMETSAGRARRRPGTSMPERDQIKTSFLPLPGSAPAEWRIEPGLTAYPEALAFMEARAEAIRVGTAGELVWLVEHPPLYTAGTSARSQDLIEPDRFQVFAAGRGGEYTYHGPGQRVAYVMLDLKRRREDVRAFVAALEQWIIETLAAFNVRGERCPEEGSSASLAHCSRLRNRTLATACSGG